MNHLYIYYLEIKNRFFLLFVCWLCVTFTCYMYKEILLFLFVNFSNYIVLSALKPYFIFTNVTEIFSVYTQLIFFISNQVLFIKFCYHLLMFLSLGLYRFEYVNLKFTLKVLVLSWGLSLFLVNQILVPLSWNFFLSFQESNELKTITLFFEAKLSEYFDFYINLYYICLLNFQFFILLTLIINNLSADLSKVKSVRKIFYFIFVIFSTLTTPPDVLSQLFVSSLLIIIYELLIFFRIFKETN